MQKGQKNRTADQIIEDTRRKKENARKRAIITDSFYPKLAAATESVENAKMLIGALGSFATEKALEKMKDIKFGDIKAEILERLCQEGEGLEEMTALLDTISDENLYVSKEIFETVNRTIQQMTYEELSERSLDTMTPKWDKYLN